jgi:class 3 adenylate cyclase
LLPNAEIAVLHAERRQLTVVFVDIVGSTPLSEQIDPEEFFAVIRTYRDICNEQISQYGGHIARMIGDGLLAYFGVPQAHEDDPERAVRASLAIAAAVREQKFPTSDGSFVRLGVRIGVNTGVVVVGSVPGEPADRREVFGSSANIAARLQEIAGENGVVVGSGTYELIRGTFSCEPLGRRQLKGVEEPVEAWRVDAVAGERKQVRQGAGIAFAANDRPNRRKCDACRDVGAERSGGRACRRHIRRTRHRQVPPHPRVA